MASFAAQAAIRSKWTSLVEEHPIQVPTEVTNKVTSVVGWLKQASLEVRAAGKRAVNSLSTGGGMAPSPSSTSKKSSDTIVILHFNDVYNVESRTGSEPVGGAARFCTAIRSFQHLQPLVLFSGDAFSPSMLSTFTKGKQMVPVLNEVGVACAVFGNHDFDHGLDVLSQWVKCCKFPWLMSNVLDNETGRPLGEGHITHVLHTSSGKQIGLIGLVEKEWLDTLPTINPDEVTFLDFVEAGRKLGAQLKQEGCDFVIALTHMRTPNDLKLAEHCSEIDLILGGHDHVFEVQQMGGKYVIKSGTDFRQFSKVSVTFDSNSDGVEYSIDVEEILIDSHYVEDPHLKKILNEYSSLIEERMDEVLGCFSVPLDGRFTSLRTGESNLGNWVCDVVLAATGADLVLLNSGTFRSDQIHEPGPFTMRDLVNVVPMRDPLVVLLVSGQQLLKVLENAVSGYPKLEGRFPQVAGIHFAFDDKKPVGQRVDPQLIRIGDEYLNMEQNYRLATKSYLYSGCDGYTMLKDAKVVMDEDECPELGLAIQNHFQAINMRLGKTKKLSKHRQSLVTLSRRHSLVKMLDTNDLDGPPPLRNLSIATSGNMNNVPMTMPAPMSTSKLSRRASLDELEQESCQLMPKIEGRIVLIQSQEKLQELLLQRKRLEADTVIPEVDDEEISPQE